MIEGQRKLTKSLSGETDQRVHEGYLAAHGEPWHWEELGPAAPFLCASEGQPSSVNLKVQIASLTLGPTLLLRLAKR
jgi:hypothetical protein